MKKVKHYYPQQISLSSKTSMLMIESEVESIYAKQKAKERIEDGKHFNKIGEISKLVRDHFYNEMRKFNKRLSGRITTLQKQLAKTDKKVK